MFSRFDANQRVLRLSWSSAIMVQLYLVTDFWLLKNPVGVGWYQLLLFLYNQFELNLSKVRRPGHSFWLVVCFTYIFLNNVLGLLPYVFTASRQLVFSFTFSLVSWITYYLVLLSFGINQYLRHLLPLGTPYLLIPLMVLIELIRGIIRPLTLGVRLVANMVAGHLLIVLVRRPFARRGWAILSVGIRGLILLVLLERGVSLIQGYVFSLLSSLYLAESNWRGLNYLNNLTCWQLIKDKK